MRPHSYWVFFRKLLKDLIAACKGTNSACKVDSLGFMPLACNLHTGFDAGKPFFESKSCEVTDDEELVDVTLRQVLGVSQVMVDSFSQQCRPIANVMLGLQHTCIQLVLPTLLLLGLVFRVLLISGWRSLMMCG